MATNTPGGQPRQQHTQVINTLRFTQNWNDPAGKLRGRLPQGAFITSVHMQIVTAFDGTAPDVTIGTAAGGTQIAAAADVDATATGVTAITRALGRSLAASGDIDIYSTNIATGAPTAGVADVVIQYEGGLG